MTMTTAWLTHLEVLGEAARGRDGAAERWKLSSQP